MTTQEAQRLGAVKFGIIFDGLTSDLMSIVECCRAEQTNPKTGEPRGMGDLMLAFAMILFYSVYEDTDSIEGGD